MTAHLYFVSLGEDQKRMKRVALSLFPQKDSMRMNYKDAPSDHNRYNGQVPLKSFTKLSECIEQHGPVPTSYVTSQMTMETP